MPTPELKNSALSADLPITKKGNAVSPDRLQTSVSEGRTSFTTKKTAGLYAVAHATIVFLGAAPASAPQHARKWLRGEIAKVNGDIDANNSRRKADRSKGFASLKGKVNIESLRAEGAQDPVAELERLQALAELDEDEFKSGQFVKLGKYDDQDEVESRAVIRFVFELYARSDAPLVSRYAKVLDWIRTRFAHDPNVEVEAIVDALKAEGGFEAVLHSQRETSGSTKGGRPKAKDDGAEAVPRGKIDDPDKTNEEEFHSDRIVATVLMPPGMHDLPLGPITFHCIVHRSDEIEIVMCQGLADDEVDEFRHQLASVLAKADAAIPDAPSIVPAEPASDAVGGEALH